MKKELFREKGLISMAALFSSNCLEKDKIHVYYVFCISALKNVFPIHGILDIQLLLTWGVVRRVFGTSPAPPAGPHQQFAHGPVPVDLSILSSYAPVPIHADHRSNEKK